jgi:hypothetical protein
MGPARSSDPADGDDKGTVLANPEQLIKLGQMLYYLAHSDSTVVADDRERQRPRKRVSQFLVGAAGVVGEVLVVAARLHAQRPDNWPSWLTYASLRVAIQDGFPVLWVPAADVLDALAKAPDRDARQQVLLDDQVDVLDHARSVLSAVTSPDLAIDRQGIEQAIECVINQPFPAQVAALNIATNRAMEEVGAPSLSALAEMGRAAVERGIDISVVNPPASLMLAAVAPALGQFYPSRGDPVPSRPNRHAVDHVTSALQYTSGNALESVLPAVSVLRQAQANREVGARAS